MKKVLTEKFCLFSCLVRGFFQIPKFTEDSELCPVHALSTYFTKVKSANFELFISLTYVVAGVQYPRRQRLLVRFLRETS